MYARPQMKYMERSLILAALLCSTANAGIWSPPLFEPTIQPDGTRTWKITMDLSDIRKEDRNKPNRDEIIAGSFIAWKNFCDAWEITSRRETKKKLFLEGRCK